MKYSPLLMGILLSTFLKAQTVESLRNLSLQSPEVIENPSDQYSYANLDYGMNMGIEKTINGRFWMRWTAGGDNPESFMLLASSDNQGRTWSNPRLVIDGRIEGLSQSRTVQNGNLWTDPLGNLWFFFDQAMMDFDGRAGVWLNATRGIITSATSELDVTIEGLTHYVLIEKLKKSEKELSSIVEEYVSDFLEKSPENFRGKHAEMGFKNVFGLIEANRKWQIFRKAIKEFKSLNDDQILTEFLKQNKTYFTEIIDIRNKFAHAKAEEKDGKLVLKGQYGKEDFELDIDSCVQIRKSIIAHKNNFEKLKVHFGI